MPNCRDDHPEESNKGVVNGYDAQGGLWFSRRVASERERQQAMQDAQALPEVHTARFEVT